LTPEASEKLDHFFRAFKSGAHPLLLLDYDGTLAGFRIDRFTARPWSGVPKLIAEIQREGGTHVAVITGRPAAEIPMMLELEFPVEVWGLHGAERLYPDGRHELQKAPPGARAKLDELRERLRSDSLGGLFEDKPNAVVMHWRGHPPKQAQLIERRTRALFEPLAEMDGLSLLDFEAGVELRVGRDKGGAVDAILAEAGPGRPVSYLGDDLTDESAFVAVNNATAPNLSVLMRHEWRPTAADVWLRPPEGLKTFLNKWLAALRDRSHRDERTDAKTFAAD
jgi:trehalose 6-phosphate phosphatase